MACRIGVAKQVEISSGICLTLHTRCMSFSMLIKEVSTPVNKTKFILVGRMRGRLNEMNQRKGWARESRGN